MIVVFDTETDGLPKPHLPPDDPAQPHVVQLAAIQLDEDGAERSSLSVLVKPEGWKIPEAASAIHGITTDTAARCGVRERVVALLFSDLIASADTLVAHNIEFDVQLVATMFMRTGRAPVMPHVRFCTMRTATPILNMPPTARMIAAGNYKPKPPKLSECIRHFFDEDLNGAHDALVDVRACARLYQHLRQVAA